ALALTGDIAPKLTTRQDRSVPVDYKMLEGRVTRRDSSHTRTKLNQPAAIRHALKAERERVSDVTLDVHLPGIDSESQFRVDRNCSTVARDSSQEGTHQPFRRLALVALVFSRIQIDPQSIEPRFLQLLKIACIQKVAV